MNREGKYLYCIICGNEGRSFGPIGIGGRGDVVSTIGYQDISAVISSTPMNHYVINQENMLSHEQVIETVMKDYTVLPVRFCTIASSAEELRTMLRRRHSELKGLLKDMDNKFEMGLKAMWKNMNQIYQEIVDDSQTIRELKQKADVSPETPTNPIRLELGRAVKEALDNKKEREGAKMITSFKRIILDIKQNGLVGDNMVLNAAFLIDRSREKSFDLMIDDLQKKLDDRLLFKYVGPAPPFHFVNLVMKW
ncbi:MAG: GvpL/GvpF family gas vesicle protein [Deltaproteobacteria bacterium]|nr:GvpL/GvpF family gas vesicle protein [Deltaproteobacteria bacterium]